MIFLYLLLIGKLIENLGVIRSRVEKMLIKKFDILILVNVE